MTKSLRFKGTDPDLRERLDRVGFGMVDFGRAISVLDYFDDGRVVATFGKARMFEISADRRVTVLPQ